MNIKAPFISDPIPTPIQDALVGPERWNDMLSESLATLRENVKFDTLVDGEPQMNVEYAPPGTSAVIFVVLCRFCANTAASISFAVVKPASNAKTARN